MFIMWIIRNVPKILSSPLPPFVSLTPLEKILNPRLNSTHIFSNIWTGKTKCYIYHSYPLLYVLDITYMYAYGLYTLVINFIFPRRWDTASPQKFSRKNKRRIVFSKIKSVHFFVLWVYSRILVTWPWLGLMTYYCCRLLYFYQPVFSKMARQKDSRFKTGGTQKLWYSEIVENIRVYHSIDLEKVYINGKYWKYAEIWETPKNDETGRE